MKMQLTFTETEIVSDTLRKIVIMLELIAVDEFDGKFTTCRTMIDASLNGSGASYVADFDPEDETMICHVWDGVMPVGSFDWHPRNEIGEFDEVKFAEGYINFINGQ